MNNSSLQRSLWLTAWIAAAFCAMVTAIMLYQHFKAATNDPWKSPQLLALKEKLEADPKNETLQTDIRQLDLKFRQQFRRRLALDKTGGWLLLGGGLVFVLAAGNAVALKKTLPSPHRIIDADSGVSRMTTRARWTVAGVGLAMAGLLAIIRIANTSALPVNPGGWQKLAGKAEELPVESIVPLVELQTNWPRFRGWDGSGASASGSNFVNRVLWRSAIPLPGESSPIVWRDRLFITGGTTNLREVFCYNVSSGALLWQRAIENVPDSPTNVFVAPEETGCAAPTMATDGHRVYAIFANGDMGALDFDGSVAWRRYLGPLKNSYGHAASLAVWGNTVLVQLDSGDSRPEGSKLISLQGASGRVLWERSRPVPASWATPIVVEAASKTQIITLANPWIISYAAGDGAELWRAQLLENEVVASPVFAGDVFVVVNPNTGLMALRPDGVGDMTKTPPIWASDQNVPDITSPVSNGELVFTVTSGGLVTCFELGSGKKIWDTNLDTEVQASPGIMGSGLFVLGKEGPLVTLQAGRVPLQMDRIELHDKFIASPAFANGYVYLRGLTNVFALGPDSAKLAKEP